MTRPVRDDDNPLLVMLRESRNIGNDAEFACLKLGLLVGRFDFPFVSLLRKPLGWDHLEELAAAMSANPANAAAMERLRQAHRETMAEMTAEERAAAFGV
jgi:hypothetical protein